MTHIHIDRVFRAVFGLRADLESSITDGVVKLIAINS